MATLAKLFVALGLDPQGFNKGLDSAESKLTKSKTSLRKIGLGFSAAFTAPALAGGAALLKIGTDFDAMSDHIRTATGKTGAALDGLNKDALAVFKSIPTTMDAAGTAIALLNQKTGATGTTLQQLAKQELELSRITGTDLAGNIQSTTTAFNEWGVAVGDQSGKLDLLFRASQATGVPVATLADQLSQYGPILRSMGIGFDQATAMIAAFGKAGIDVGQVVNGMRFALAKFAKDGVTDPAAAFKSLMDQIKTAPTAMAATDLAVSAFGSRIGPQLAEMIRSGALSYDDLMTMIANGKDTILGASADTMDLAEKWQIFKNRITVAVLPIATRLFDFMNAKGIPALNRMAGAVETIVQRFMGLSRPVKIGIAAFGAFLAALGPVLIMLGTLASAVGSITALFAEGGALAGLGALLGPILLVVAALAALGLAYKTNFLGFADAVNWVAKQVVKYGTPIVQWFGKLLHFLNLVAHGGAVSTDQFKKMPKPLRAIMLILGQVVNLVRRFVVAWRQAGALAAFKTLPLSIRMIGRALGSLAGSLGLRNLRVALRDLFNAISHVVNDIINLVDDVFHGRWKQAWEDFKNLAMDGVRLWWANMKVIPSLLYDLFKMVNWSEVGNALLAGLIDLGVFLVTVTGPFYAQQGWALLQWLWSGLVNFWTNTLAPWLAGLAAGILAYFTDGGFTTDLYNAGNAIIGYIADGITFGWNWLMGWLGKLPGRIVDAFDSYFNSFYNTGAYLVNAMASGVSSAYNGMWNAGHYIMQGLLDGIMWMWNNVIVGTLNWITGQIPFHKGPLAKDKVLLKPAGAAIMQGLNDSIAAGVPALVDTLGKVSAAISGGVTGNPGAGSMAPNVAAMPALANAATNAGSRSLTVNAPVTVNGANLTNDQVGEIVAKKLMRKIQAVQAGAV